MAECKCFDNWKELLKEDYEKNNPGKVVSKVDITPKALVMNMKRNRATLATCSYGELTLEGRKKPIEITLNHTYCPFCGVKIDYENEEEKQTQNEEGAKKNDTNSSR